MFTQAAIVITKISSSGRAHTHTRFRGRAVESHGALAAAADTRAITRPAGMLRLGFWRQSPAGRGSMDTAHKREHGSLLPWPAAREDAWDGQDVFVSGVDQLCSIARQVGFMGFSRCRICQQPNGSKEHGGAGLGYCITEGYLHYVRSHNLQPTDEERHAVSALVETHAEAIQRHAQRQGSSMAGSEGPSAPSQNTHPFSLKMARTTRSSSKKADPVKADKPAAAKPVGETERVL